MGKLRGVSKWLVLLLALALVVPLASCTDGEEAPSASAPTPTPMPTATPMPSPGASAYTATISSPSGEVLVSAAGVDSWLAASHGMKVGEGDSLKTGSDGYAMLLLHDGSVLEIEADSEMTIDELSVASGGSTTVRISQTLGNLVHRVENLVDSESIYEVNTPAGLAVVRGTWFVSMVNFLGLSCYECWEDCVEFTAGGVMVDVCKWFKSCAWPGGTPCTPFHTDPARDPLNAGGDDDGPGITPTPTQSPCYSPTPTPSPSPTGFPID